MNKVNFSDEPLPRLVNGFRIRPERIEDSDMFIWHVKPNESSFWFYFPTFKDAELWCSQFQNCHKDGFWLRRWMPLYRRETAIRLREGDCVYGTC